MGARDLRRWIDWRIGLAIVLVMAAVSPVRFPLDDAYITLHNARSLLEGGDPLYGQNPLVGATSPAHLLAVTLFALIFPLPNASLIVSTLSVAAYAAGLWRWGAKVTVIGLTAATVSVHLFNGLETPMAMAAVTWAIIWMDDRRLPWLAGVMPFIRPELGLLSVILLGRDFWRRRDWKAPAIAVLVALPFIVWTYAATGHVLPNTVAAKMAFFRNDLSPWQRIRTVFDSTNEALVSPLLLAMAFLPRKRGGWALMLFLVGWLLTVTLSFPEALWSNSGRYWLIAVPILCYGLPRMALWPVMGLTLVGALLLFLDPPTRDTWPSMVKAAARLPAGSTVLVHDAGNIAWSRPPLKLVDVVGLKTPRSAEIIRAHHSRRCEWGPALDQIARESGATYAIVLDTDPFWGCISGNFREVGWQLDPVFVDPQGFTIYRLHPPANARPLTLVG